MGRAGHSITTTGCYAFFAPFIASPESSATEFVRQLFATLPAGGLTADLAISSLVFWIWSFDEARARGMARWWAYPVVNVLIGLSCALPLFLYVRAGRAEREARAG